MYKQACMLGLRIQTTKGPLSAEQACTLRLGDLSQSLKNLKKELDKTDGSGLDFLEENKSTNPLLELGFNILKDIYLTKKAAATAEHEAALAKEGNQKILAEMARRKELRLTQMTDDELEAMLK